MGNFNIFQSVKSCTQVIKDKDKDTEDFIS